ncbi:MAG: DNA sulfur modification protein DndB [Chloroflexi bacterium CFX4]|nr:DNA sulfur modification protein DndB [Chloroflexi bacterium CFX4]MDL1921996.1 DNA sulfur modification protein DndB [Chloroflexi bacterium CFX3]
MDSNTYQFPAVRGIQAQREYYVVMCPLKLIPRLFVFDDDEVPADLRAQRSLNRARVPDIARYLVNNADDYVLSSITACIDGDIHFEPFASKGSHRNLGFLYVDMKSRILVNDGQHRRAAIAEAIKERPSLGDETISVVFFVDAGLERSQQWFADLNKHAVRPTRSISVLYDRRDPMSQLCRDLVCRVPIFDNGFTELEKTSISNRSTKIFTLNAIYQSTRALLCRKRNEPLRPIDKELAILYWTKLGELIPEWQMVIRRQVSPAELRQHYIHVHGVVLHALGIAGRALIQQSRSWQHEIVKIENTNWERSNEIWQGRAVVHGRMSKANESVTLTANVIKQELGLPLSKDELSLERRFAELSGK